MSDPLVIGALKRKRGELSGEMQDLERRMKACRAALAHVDETIRLFAPDFNVKGIKPIRRVRRARYFDSGELARYVQDYMRTHPENVAGADITLAVMASKGMETGNPSLRGGIHGLVLNVLRAMAKRRLVTRTGVSQDARWHLERESD
jgi:hypothetical protein